MLSIKKSVLGYCSDIKITLPPSLSQDATNDSPIKGLPEPPGPEIIVDVFTGNPSGINLSKHSFPVFIVFICITIIYLQLLICKEN